MNTEYFTNKLALVLEKINQNSLNYVAHVVLYPPTIVGANSTEESVKSVLGGNVQIEEISQVSSQNVTSELKLSLGYSGDYGSHPNNDYVGSELYKTHITDLENKLKPLLASATKILSFVIKEGHSFYPVFWDFAFSIEANGEAYVFIGSSSD